MPNAYILSVPSNTQFGHALSLLVEMLVSAGWSYKGSGDGLSGYSAAGKIFTNVGPGANGWNNDTAWARIADPEGKREFIFQHNSTSGARFKYSAAAKFVGGTPSAKVSPTATDERFLWGSVGGLYPQFWDNLATIPFKFHGMASATPPYGFWYCGSRVPNAGIASAFMMDPIDGPAEDTDPVVFHLAIWNAYKSAYSGATYGTSGAGTEGCYTHVDLARNSFLGVSPAAYGFGDTATGNGSIYRVAGGGIDLNQFNGKHEALPIVYGRPASQTTPGLKGWSKLARWTTVARTHAFDTLDNLKWVCIGNLWLPWDGVTPPTN